MSKEIPFHLTRKYYQSPRREVQTQTQGESKSVQCCLDELGSLYRILDSFDSPSRSEKSYVKESKSIQCIPEDIPSSLDKSTESLALLYDQGKSLRSPRKEVEVQTYQESKAIQCSDDELLEVVSESPDNKEGVKKTESSGSSSCGSPCKLRIPTLVFVEERVDMTVTHRDHEGNVSWSKHWGPERLVEIYREPKTSLGLSIVGGKVRNADTFRWLKIKVLSRGLARVCLLSVTGTGKLVQLEMWFCVWRLEWMVFVRLWKMVYMWIPSFWFCCWIV